MKELKCGPLLLRSDEAETFCTVALCDKDATAADIPAEAAGLPVKGIDDAAFENCTKLVSVTFSPALDRPTTERSAESWGDPDAGFTVGASAFAGCTALTAVSLPDCVSSVGHGAFRGCTALERVQMPDCFCEPYVFYHCENLKEITPITDIGEGMFSHCKALTTFPVAPGSWIIGEDAFEHCYALTEITIPASVKRIEQLAFRNCLGLKRVTFEHTEGWKWKSMYGFSKDSDRSWDVSDPERNAHSLAGEDFDDGVTCRYRD
jgi:hypothetical protein